MARFCLVVLLAGSLLDLPAFAAVEKPLGSVIQAQEAQLDNAKLEVGTSIYRGDTVGTDAGGGLRLRLGGSRLSLLADSADSIELEIPQGILRAADGQPAYGQVTILSAQEVVISAYRGALVLDNDGELHTFAAGKSYRLSS